MEAIINTPLEDCSQFVYSDLAVTDDFAAGDVELIGASLLGIVVEQAAGATVRAATLAAGGIVEPDRCTMVLKADHVTILKNTSLVISKGDIVYWDVADGNVNKTALANHACGIALADAAEAATTVDIVFDGTGTLGATAGS